MNRRDFMRGLLGMVGLAAVGKANKVPSLVVDDDTWDAWADGAKQDDLVITADSDGYRLDLDPKCELRIWYDDQRLEHWDVYWPDADHGHTHAPGATCTDDYTICAANGNSIGIRGNVGDPGPVGCEA